MQVCRLVTRKTSPKWSPLQSIRSIRMNIGMKVRCLEDSPEKDFGKMRQLMTWTLKKNKRLVLTWPKILITPPKTNWQAPIQQKVKRLKTHSTRRINLGSKISPSAQKSLCLPKGKCSDPYMESHLEALWLAHPSHLFFRQQSIINFSRNPLS